MSRRGRAEAAGGDLSITALYTAGTWAWAGLAGAELFDHADARRVFGATNGALALARPFQRRAPSLRHSLVQRHVMIDAVVRESGAAVVLELAAGLSRRGAAMSADPRRRYVELDRPEVVARKRRLLERSDAGRAVLARPNFVLAEGDALTTPLLPLVAAPPTAPIAVVAEGLCMYLDEPTQATLWARVAALLAGRRGSVFVFDYVPPSEQPGAGLTSRALGWLMRRATGGATFARDQRNRDEVARAVGAAGFDSVRMLAPAEAPAAWAVPHLDVFTQQLVFVARVT